MGTPDTDTAYVLPCKVETDLTFVGLVGMIDPPRPECSQDEFHRCKRFLECQYVRLVLAVVHFTLLTALLWSDLECKRSNHRVSA